jgi:hypothetical protein
VLACRESEDDERQKKKAVDAQASGTGQGQLIREVLIDFNVGIQAKDRRLLFISAMIEL